MRKISFFVRSIANKLDWWYSMSSLYRYKVILISIKGIKYETEGVLTSSEKGMCLSVFNESFGRFIETNKDGVVIGWSCLNGDKILSVNGIAYKEWSKTSNF
jgi:hypothetical protein